MAGNMMKEMTTNFKKLDKFEGYDFRRWQKKMHFLLTTLKAKWENDDYICRGHILNGMSDFLFDVYTNVESTKELWDSLESKYMAEDSLSKKFLDFKHTLKHGKDDLSLVQLGSHLRIEESLKAQDSDKGKGKEVAGPFVNMTEEGKNKNNKQNKGKKHDFKEHSSVVKRTTQMLVIRERGLRTNPKTKVDAIAWWIDSGATTHVCKDRCWFKTYEPVEDGSVLYMGDEHFAPVHGKGSVALEFSSNKKPKLECWECGKIGHFKKDWRSGKKNNANAGGSGKGSKDQSQDQGQNLVTIWNSFMKFSVSLISEAFYVQVDAIAWWIDSGATTHVCKDRCWFKTYEPVEDGFVLYMGDDHFAPVYGKGSMALEFSSGKIITLFNVLYLPKLRKNLVSGLVLNKCGYKQVPTRNLSWNVGSGVRLVTSKRIAVVVKRTTQMLVVRERGLRTNPKTKVDAITWWIDSGATNHVCKDR
nr:zinc finger, CCHC-type [Tanacetum cinerariifolium]